MCISRKNEKRNSGKKLHCFSLPVSPSVPVRKKYSYPRGNRGHSHKPVNFLINTLPTHSFHKSQNPKRECKFPREGRHKWYKKAFAGDLLRIGQISCTELFQVWINLLRVIKFSVPAQRVPKKDKVWKCLLFPRLLFSQTAGQVYQYSPLPEALWLSFLGLMFLPYCSQALPLSASPLNGLFTSVSSPSKRATLVSSWCVKFIFARLV